MSWAGKKVPMEVSQSLHNLRNDPNFRRVLDWIRDGKRFEESEIPGWEDGTHTRWAQGSLRTLNHIIGANDRAEEEIRKAIQQQKPA